ncbi:MAG: nucleotidyltransferase family protein [Mycobacteriaceae bacterium]|uniref:nucleotidyltransferase family protein n=1 Tax=Corynebacterium sp. TaxID=1720 RepID=UPI003F972893
MTTPAGLDSASITDVCIRFDVARLKVFGSRATGQFDPVSSDIDFLVEFQPTAAGGIGPFLALKEQLEQVVGRNVDLVEESAVRNPFFYRHVLAEAVDVYEA